VALRGRLRAQTERLLVGEDLISTLRGARCLLPGSEAVLRTGTVTRGLSGALNTAAAGLELSELRVRGLAVRIIGPAVVVYQCGVVACLVVGFFQAFRGIYEAV